MPKPIKRAQARPGDAEVVAKMQEESLIRNISALSGESAAEMDRLLNEDIKLTEEQRKVFEGILERSRQIDPSKVAADVLEWLIANVKEYVENKNTLYTLAFPTDAFDVASEAGKLNALYSECPATAAVEEIEYLDALHAITEKAKEFISNDTVRLRRLFEALSMFYDTKLAVSGGKLVPMTIKLDGDITIHDFVYETMQSVTEYRQTNVKLTSEQAQSSDLAAEIQSAKQRGDVETTSRMVKTPCGFYITFEFTYWPAA